MLSKQDKVQKIERFKARLEAAEVVIIAENKGLTAKDMERLRGKLCESEGQAQVVKNTLAKRALEGGRFQALSGRLSGALVYGVGKDPSQVAKIFTDLAKENPKFIICGGVLPEKEAMDGAGVSALAKLPSRQDLLAKLLGTMQAPMTKLVSTLHAVPSGFVRALAAIKDQKNDGESRH